MAKYRKGKEAKYAECVEDDNGNEANAVRGLVKEPDIAVHESLFDISDHPFSAINSALLPTSMEDAQEIFDQFGFRIDDESNIDFSKLIETSQDRMRWLAHIEFAHEDIPDELTWSKVDVSRLNNEKTIELLRTIGIAHSLRPFLWPRFCGATAKKNASSFTYENVVKQCIKDKPSIGAQIEKDLLRTLPNNICFWRENSKGIEALRRVLRSVAYMYPDVGYCQGMGVIVASLLLFCSEETTFWIMSTLIEDIFPPNYYSRSLLGLQADERVARQLMSVHLPEVDRLLKENDVEMSLISVNWLLTAFASVFPMRILLRIWDFLFVNGGVTIFRTMISILKLREDDLIELSNSENASADLFNTLSEIPSHITDVEHLIEMCISFEFSITPELIENARRHQQAVLLADQGLIINPNRNTNLPKQRVQRRKLVRSKSLVQHIFAATNEHSEEKDPKMKNVRQTELIVDLRDAILQVCRYFIDCDESFASSVNLQADYSSEGHVNEKEEFLRARRRGHRRARALLDFQRQDEDELGFMKNDIITVICEKDEHCWVGEVNGLRGWFPAKFVEIVDERGKNYTVFGDEAVCPEVTEQIRGRLASALKPILEHGLRKSGVLSLAVHPWLFIEEVASHYVQNHFNAVYSRLTLCSTFSLDQDGKVLTPEELLYRAVQLINDSHNAVGAQMDVKLRSLIALSVNEQCLHLWFDLLCSRPAEDAIREKYYHSWAFIRSPIWKQIKCELRLLAQFCFNLSVDFEIADTAKNKRISTMSANLKKKSLPFLRSDSHGSSLEQPLKEGVRDMLIKHHLFSWDL
uniref:RUN and TBC1 domain-containing protein 3 n=1 Tax=Ascaris suum TaxID=6253 RepID=F1KV49_ASCSU